VAYDAQSEAFPKPDKSRAMEVMRRSEALFTAQRQHAMLWQALAEIFYPERADFITQRTAGAERYEGIFDTEPQIMRRDLGNNLGAMLRTRGRDWFALRASDDQVMEDDGAKRWCEEGTRRLRNVIYSSRANFTAAMAQADQDYVTIGNAIVVHTFNRDQTGLLFRCAHPRDVAWAENEELAIDEVHEKMRMSLRQLALTFGVDRLPPKIKDRLNKDATEMMVVRRCVAPIDQYAYATENGGRKAPRDMRYASTYILEDGAEPLAEAYFRTFPYLIRRWLTVSGEPYGRSPAAGVALADARTLNVAQAAVLKSIEWAVDPPKVAVDDGVVGEIRLEAGGITYVDATAWEPSRGEPIRSLSAGDPRQGMDFLDRGHQRLSRAFFQNLLKLPEREMTAYEAGERMEMYTREAAPIFEPMEAENGILMEGVFERAYFKGLFEAPPEALHGADVKFEFETPLSIAMRKMRAQQAAQAKQSLAQSAQLDPTILDNVDFDAMVRDEMEGIGPVKWIRPKDQVEALRQARAEQQAAEKQQALMAQAATVAARANPQNLAAAENGMDQLQQQGEGPEEQAQDGPQGEGPGDQDAPAQGQPPTDWQALLQQMGQGQQAAAQGAMPAQAASAMPPQPPPMGGGSDAAEEAQEDKTTALLAKLISQQGQMFERALDKLGDKLSAPRVAVRDRDGKIVGSKVEG
jgi:hypothetical protein